MAAIQQLLKKCHIRTNEENQFLIFTLIKYHCLPVIKQIARDVTHCSSHEENNKASNPVKYTG